MGKKGAKKPTVTGIVAERSRLPKRQRVDKVAVYVDGKTKTEFRRLKKANPKLTRAEYLAS